MDVRGLNTQKCRSDDLSASEYAKRLIFNNEVRAEMNRPFQAGRSD